MASSEPPPPPPPPPPPLAAPPPSIKTNDFVAELTSAVANRRKQLDQLETASRPESAATSRPKPIAQSATAEKYRNMDTLKFHRAEKGSRADWGPGTAHSLRPRPPPVATDEENRPVERSTLNPMIREHLRKRQEEKQRKLGTDDRVASTSSGAAGDSADVTTASTTPVSRQPDAGVAAPPPVPTRSLLKEMGSDAGELWGPRTDRRVPSEAKKKPLGKGRAMKDNVTGKKTEAFLQREREFAVRRKVKRKRKPRNPFIDDEAAVDNDDDDGDEGDEEEEEEEEEEEQEEQEALAMGMNEDEPLFLPDLADEDEDMQQAANVLQDRTPTPLSSSSKKQGPSKPLVVDISDGEDSDDMYMPFPEPDRPPPKKTSKPTVTIETVSDEEDPSQGPLGTVPDEEDPSQGPLGTVPDEEEPFQRPLGTVPNEENPFQHPLGTPWTVTQLREHIEKNIEQLDPKEKAKHQQGPSRVP
ncbi:hypothetical protein MPER_12969, partial [Moniliophthora perniciosa FA553]